MINARMAGIIGIVACIWFWSASFVFGALRPAYSHVVNTISELGALGTPYATYWNILGFIVTGLLLALVGAVVANAVGGQRPLSAKVSRLMLIVAGLAIAGQGLIPAEMANGTADITSPYTRGHFISSLVSGGAWMVGVVLLVSPMRRDAQWHGWHIVSAVLVLITLAAWFALQGTLPDGLAQRLGNASFFSWYVLMSLKLIRLKDHKSVPGDAKRASAA